jgi:histidyl-tRNA synthetase
MTMELLLEQRGLLADLTEKPDIYVVIGGAAERPAALGLVQELRAAGWRVEYALREMAFGKQFKAAAECGARLAAIVGGDELARGVVKLRRMDDRTETEVAREQAVGEVKLRLA